MDDTNDTMPADDEATGRKKDAGKRIAAMTVAVAAALALVGGGWAGWNAYEAHRLETARAACADASESLRIAMNEYNTLKTGKASTMAGVTAKQVKDEKTVTALAEALKAQEPKTAACTADSRAGYEQARGRVETNRDWYARHKASLKKAAEAVGESRDAKTLADGAKLLNDSKGKVADEGARDALDKAIKAKDTQAAAKAVKAVDDSVKAKEKADAQAKAKAEAQAQAAAAAAAQAQQSWSSGSGSGYTGYTGNGYSAGGYSGNTWSGGSPTSTGGNTSTPSTGSSGSSSSGGSTWTDPNAGAADGFDWDYVGPSVCEPGKFCPLA